ncbi:hypothetical protein HNR05_000397 [Leifsonia psychrotolerans]|uniref:Uncharacterized protein n=1 Tax=Glaciibacter psychrotolerans TaxID=670054 RepID=A0A7Z0J4Z0_9MICO|nr:hypothetical protein [Leifsonia psychrotolerans]
MAGRDPGQGLEGGSRDLDELDQRGGSIGGRGAGRSPNRGSSLSSPRSMVSRVAHGISTSSINGRVRTRSPKRRSSVSRPRSPVSGLAHGISTSSINGCVRLDHRTVGRACRDLVPRFRDWRAGSRHARSTEGYGGLSLNRGSSLSRPRSPVSGLAHGISTSSINGGVRTRGWLTGSRHARSTEGARSTVGYGLDYRTVGRACRDLAPRFRDWLTGSRRARSTVGYGLEGGARDLDTLDQRRGLDQRWGLDLRRRLDLRWGLDLRRRSSNGRGAAGALWTRIRSGCRRRAVQRWIRTDSLYGAAAPICCRAHEFPSGSLK